MSFQEDRCDFPLSFHLVSDKGNHGEVKPSRRRVEMEGQFNSILESNMKLELTQVNCYGASFGIFPHLFVFPKSY